MPNDSDYDSYRSQCNCKKCTEIRYRKRECKCKSCKKSRPSCYQERVVQTCEVFSEPRSGIEKPRSFIDVTKLRLVKSTEDENCNCDKCLEKRNIDCCKSSCCDNEECQKGKVIVITIN